MHDNDNKFLPRFAKAATIRAVRTFAQTVASCAGIAVLAAVNSLLTSIGTGLPEIELPAFPDSGDESP